MPKVAASNPAGKPRNSRPAMDPDDRDKQLVALAVDLAEKQLRDGTASSQVITHYLKIGSPHYRLEKEKLELENELTKAKAESIKQASNRDETYQKAIEAMRRYSGNGDPDEY